ncbi:MAG: DUF2905 domain-containing protein [Thermotaleaceae bacterium]
MESFAKQIMFFSIVLFVIGFILFVGSKFGLGRLPGDIYYKKENLTIYFPIVTSILLSIVLSILFNVFFKK